MSTFVSKSGYTYKDRGVNPLLGIRVGVGACRHAVEHDYSPRGATMRLAADLAKFGAEHTCDAAGNVLPAPLTNEVKDPSKVKPSLFVEHIHSAERWYSTHRRKPNRAEMAALWSGQDLTADEVATVRAILKDTLTRTTTDGWLERAEQKRRARAEREARQRAAKAK